MQLLYMNQGGGGDWGALRYSQYDVLCIAECPLQGGTPLLKQGFAASYASKTDPAMSIQVQEDAGRIITEVSDLDEVFEQVRPVLSFQLTKLAPVRCAFVHFKSGNAALATQGLQSAVAKAQAQWGAEAPILWIGDFNRAAALAKGTVLLEAGGISQWWLDRAVTTGDWSKFKVQAAAVSKSSDNQHTAIAVTIVKA